MTRRLRFAVLWVAFMVALAELTARVFLAIVMNASLLDPRTAIRGFYPGLRSVMERTVDAADDPVDVLLLGGSVLNRDWGSVPAAISEQIAWSTRRQVRVHNLAQPAHSSRDSLLKYRRLESQHFDVVLFYHGINEARANNVPPELFELDYSHYSWYRVVNRIDRDPWVAISAVPLTTQYIVNRLALHFGAPDLVPTHRPREEWLEHGSVVKTAAPFRANLEAIARLAAGRSEPLLVLTFAFYLAPGYSAEAFERHELDYTQHRTPADLWGRPEHVVAALEAHNQAVREVAEQRPDVYFVDVAAHLPGTRANFDDVCHLTTSGSQALAALIAPSLLAAVEREPPARIAFEAR